MTVVSVAEPILVLFAIVLAGFLAGRFGGLDGAGTRVLSGVLLKVTLPALIIDSLQRSYSPDILRASLGMLAVSVPAYAVTALIALAAGRLLQGQGERTGLIRFAVMFPNTGFMGYPVVQSILGGEALFLAVVYNLPFNLLVFTFGVWLLTSGRGDSKSFDWRILVNPTVAAVVVGFVLFLTQVRLPGALADAVAVLGQATTPLAMVVVGATLAGMADLGQLGKGLIYKVSSLRLLVAPLLIWVMARTFIADQVLLFTLVLLNAMPVAINSVILAAEHDADPNLASQLVFVSTALSLLTIPVVMLVISAF